MQLPRRAFLAVAGASLAPHSRLYGQQTPRKEEPVPQLTVPFRTGGLIFSFFTPDSTKIISVGAANIAVLWDVATGRQLRVFSGHTRSVYFANVTADGKRIITASIDGTVRAWDVETAKELLQAPLAVGAPGADFTQPTLSADGHHLLARSSLNAFTIWNVDTRARVYDYPHPSGATFAVFVSRERFASGDSAGNLRFWSLSSQTPELTAPGHPGPIMYLAVSSDNTRLLSCSDDGTVIAWNVTTREKLWARKLTSGSGVASFSPDGSRIAIGGIETGMITLLRSSSGEIEKQFLAHEGNLSSLEISRDGQRLVSAGITDSTVKLWRIPEGVAVRTFTSDFGTFSPSGHALLCQDSIGATIHPLSADHSPRRLQSLNSAKANAMVSEDGKQFSVVADTFGGQRIRLWSLESGQELSLGFPSDTPVLFERFVSGRGALAVIMSSRSLSVMAVERGVPLLEIPGPVANGTRVALSPDGTELLRWVPGADIERWNIAAEIVVGRIVPPDSSGFQVDYSLMGNRILACGANRTVSVYDRVSGALIRAFPEPGAEGRTGALSADGSRLATFSHGVVDLSKAPLDTRVWDVDTGKEQVLQDAQHHGVFRGEFSKDGSFLATASVDGLIRIWNLKTNKIEQSLTGHKSWASSARFLREGRQVLSSGEDGTVRLWDTASGKQLALLASFTDGTWAVLDSEGRYDASNAGAIDHLYWTVGTETIDLNQLKERYYTPRLLAKILGYNPGSLRDVTPFQRSKTLYPQVQAALRADKTVEITLKARSGGIGKCQVFVNDVLYDERAKPPGNTPFTVDLSRAPTLRARGDNDVRVVAFHAENWFSSPRVLAAGAVARGPRPGWVPEKPLAWPRLFAVCIGCSNYSDPTLHLSYPDADARAMAAVLEQAAAKFPGTERRHISLLTSDHVDSRYRPTRANLLRLFDELAAHKPTSDDILLIYLAGHGITLPGNKSLYAYLLADATTSDPETLAKDKELRKLVCLTNDDLEGMFNRLGASYRVAILDTCAAGDADLATRRSIPDEQIRALERFKDRTGFHILMGCTAGKTSYESSRYGHGVLTYALLQGLKGPGLREREWVDVESLFKHAETSVLSLAGAIGGIQQPRYEKSAAGSSDIGRLTSVEQAAITLSTPLPQIVRPRLAQPDGIDDLELEPLVRKALLNALNPVSRGGTERTRPSALYIDGDNLADAYDPRGSYTITGTTVNVTLKLRRNRQTVAELALTGTSDRLPELAAAISTAIIAAVK